MVDEFQDTNFAQYQLVKMLSGNFTTPSASRPPLLKEGGEAPRDTSLSGKTAEHLPLAEGEYHPKGGEGVGVNDTILRLQSFTKTQDGFELAELDLKQRGFGEIYGQTQSGWNFKYFDPSYTSLIHLAREEAIKILKDDDTLEKYPLLKERIAGKIVHFE
jgi:hypothetical protein